MVSYEEFCPLAFELLVKVLSGALPNKPVPAPAPAKKEGWSAYSNLYGSKSPTEQPMKKQAVSGSDEVATLEGRVLAVQSRRIIRSKIKDLFAKLDSDKDGRITIPELASAFGDSMARRIQGS